MTKYSNKKIDTVDGKFDSKKEYVRWCELKMEQRAKLITDLQRQVPFVLIPAQRDDVTGKVVEREVKYIADFVYKENGKTVVEDVKSEATKTREYIIKRKLLLKEFGLRIKEV